MDAFMNLLPARIAPVSWVVLAICALALVGVAVSVVVPWVQQRKEQRRLHRGDY